MEQQNDVSKVISRTALIENLLNQIILKYSSPRKEAFQFFWDVLLDSSIMPLGSKVKVVMAITQNLGGKLNSTPIHKVISLRNAFAHHDINAHATIAVGKTPEEDESYYMLQIITQSGKVDRKRREDALEEFNINYKLAKEALVKLKDLLENKFT